jgi:ABC-2 type transport system permease protein
MTPIWHLTIARIREFLREPAAVFWVYCFPLLTALILGIAFRERPIENIEIDFLSGGDPAVVEDVKAKLAKDTRIKIKPSGEEDWKTRLRSGKTTLVVSVTEAGVELWDEPNRPDSILARHAVEAALYRPTSPVKPAVIEHHLEETGTRYIDFLLPGMIGMNLMGGGLWGVGFVLVDMRVRKLLKRYLATPMRKSDFLLSIMFSRMIFTIPEVMVLLLFGWAIFGVKVAGSLIALIVLMVLAAACFAGIGLLIASRAKTIETASGLMNMVMLPMYFTSGVFFSYERFPEVIHPFLRMLPLTATNDALRGVMLEAKPLSALLPEIAVISAWGCISFFIALKFFRWK